MKQNQLTLSSAWPSLFALLIFACDGPLLAQPTLQITAPSNGTVVTPGTAVTLSITPSANGVFANVFVIGWDPIGWVAMDVSTTPPWQLSLQIPSPTDPGRYKLTAGGVPTAGGEPIFSQPLSIQVERTDNPVSISVELDNLFLSVGKRAHMLVWGVYSDGTFPPI